MRAATVFLLVLSTACALWSCGCRRNSSESALKPLEQTPAMDPNYVVAMINDTPLTWESMDLRAEGFLKDDIENNHLIVPEKRMEEAREHFRRRSIKAFAYKTIMLAEASKQRITPTEADRRESLRGMQEMLKGRNWTTNDFFTKGPMDEVTMRREFEDGVVIDKLLKLNVRPRIKVENSEVDAAIARISASNRTVRVKLDAIRDQILAGADFTDVARNVSQDGSAKNGGDLGEFTRGKLFKGFEKAAFSQEIGEVGPVFATRYGYHILKVTSRTPATPATDSTPAVPESVRLSQILLKTIPVDRKKLMDSILRVKFKQASEAYYRELLEKSKLECYLYPDLEF